MVLACPSVKRGQVRVELYGRRKTVIIDAHEGPLAAMVLTVDGSVLATASERGTIIRLFDTGKQGSGGGGMLSLSSSSSSQPLTGTPIREFRRGVEQAKIGCLCFSLDKAWLGCTSDRGTVHIFRINKEEESNDDDKATRGLSRQGGGRSKKSLSTSTASKIALSFLPNVLTKSAKTFLLEGENSYAQVRGISQPQACAFVPHQHNTIAVAGIDDYGNGCLLLAKFGSQDKEDAGGQDHLQHDACGSQHGRDDTTEVCKTSNGEVSRVAFHRFFKKGMSKLLKKNYSNGIVDDEELFVFSDSKDDGLDHPDDTTEQIVFCDDDTDGFVSVKSDCQLTSGGVLEEKKTEIEGSHHTSSCIGNNDGVIQGKKEIETKIGGSFSNKKAENVDYKSSQ